MKKIIALIVAAAAVLSCFAVFAAEDGIAVFLDGGKLEFDYGDIQTVYFENKVTENWKNG